MCLISSPEYKFFELEEVEIIDLRTIFCPIIVAENETFLVKNII